MSEDFMQRKSYVYRTLYHLFRDIEILDKYGIEFEDLVLIHCLITKIIRHYDSILQEEYVEKIQWKSVCRN